MRRLLYSIRQFLSELRRRNVYRVALAYLAAGLVVVELADIAVGTFTLPGWFGPMVWVLVGLDFPIALVLAWALEGTSEGGACGSRKGRSTSVLRQVARGTCGLERRCWCLCFWARGGCGGAWVP